MPTPYALIIDDNRITADSLSQWLSLLGCEPHVALGPLRAIEALAQRLPDVIFLDIHMKGMDGIELCRYARRDPRTSLVPIIAMSSDSQTALIDRVRQAGANGFLSKPFEFEALEEVLAAVARLNAANALSAAKAAAPRPPLEPARTGLARRPVLR